MDINENLQRIAAAKTAIRNKIYEKGETTIPVDIAIEVIYEYLQNFYYEEEPEVYEYLTFKCEDPNGTATILLLHNTVGNTKVFEYSLDNEKTWNTFNEDETYTISNGLKLMLRSTDVLPMATGIGTGTKYRHFTLSGDNIEVLGNVMSLMNFTDKITTNYAFLSLFKDNSSIVRLSENLLSCKTISGTYVYTSMFQGCTGLTSLPENLLPATTLAGNCYLLMFQGCTGLTSLPENLLPATTLASLCYYSMFLTCSGLTSLPENLLPATRLASSCYYGMFLNCSGLTSLPLNLLPATTLASTCYYSMFLNCSNLTNTPKLPALTLGTTASDFKNRYLSMFLNCSKLSTVYCNARYAYGTTDIDGTTFGKYGTSWLYGVASSGTFYKNSAVTYDTRSVNFIPSGWTTDTYN